MLKGENLHSHKTNYETKKVKNSYLVKDGFFFFDLLASNLICKVK